MQFKVRGNYLGTETFKSRKSGEQYRVVKVIVDDEKYQCFADMDINLVPFERLEEVFVMFELSPYQNTFNLQILSIDKVK